MERFGHMIYKELYMLGRTVLEKAGVPEAELNARLLLEQVCGTKRSDLLAHGDRIVGPEEQKAYEGLLEMRGRRIPLQHLTGMQNFMGLDFLVDENVLIPRQDTEILVEEVLKNLHDGMRVLDMCTGSGCILISLLHFSNNCQGVGADISEEALAVAKKNAARLLKSGGCDAGCGEDGFGRIDFLRSDLFGQIQGKFDIIVSNPPYVRSGDIPGLMPEVREHEPLQALDGGGDGLVFYRRILEEGRKHLFGGGMLFFEIGHDQSHEVSCLMEEAGFLEVDIVKDYAGLDRVVYGTFSHGPH